MAVMRVRIVGMRVREHLVLVRMRVPRPRSDRLAVGVPVMRVVPMLVGVLQWLVRVPVLVPLGQVQPDACGHQDRSNRERRGQRLSEERHGEDGARKRRRRKIGAGARRAELAQGEHEQRQAHAVAEKSDAGPPRAAVPVDGSFAPATSASAAFVVPATRPFTIAM